MPPDPPVSVVLADDQPVGVDIDRLTEVATRAAVLEGAQGEISISLVNEDRMTELNVKYMGHEGPTDVLSFPVDGRRPHSSAAGEPALIGEVVLCPAYAANSDPDLAAELDLLVTHGVLHLLGYDHDTKAKTALMQAAEVRVIGRSGAEAARPVKAVRKDGK